ncbi:diaminopimelate epimerase [Brevibacillus sp. FSL L8-0710]|uniref:diaminopimelate epimerase n=1 Tax=Brevibacillus sp. FSL L8-0710 TaxID=2975313 RepID=UPI0030FB84F6
MNPGNSIEIMKRCIPFAKMHGCGNDFLIMDNRQEEWEGKELGAIARRLCNRETALGADGCMWVEKSDVADFSMRYFNADGSEGEMCGNGARCIARYAFEKGIAPAAMRFAAKDGLYHSLVEGRWVDVYFPAMDRADFFLNRRYEAMDGARQYHFAVVGVPHTVWFVADTEEMSDEQVSAWGKAIRYDHSIFPDGVNVNFVQIADENKLKIRTYERGVERETLACGSGATASAITSSLLGLVASPVTVLTRGGELRVSFRLESNLVRDIVLGGPTRWVASGYLLPEMWM